MTSSHRYCLIGHPVSHSFSPQIHNAWFREHGIDAKYELQDVFPHELPTFMQRFRREFVGANVTIPYKEEVIQYLDNIDEIAEQIGAVNLILNTDGILTGFNTDWIGALQALALGVTGTREIWEGDFLQGKSVVILGAGGAAKAIAYAVDRAGASLIFVTRTRAKAQNCADFYDGEALEFTELEELSALKGNGPDIVINATPVGMSPHVDESPVPQKFWSEWKAGVAMDIVFSPLETQFLKDAKEAGWKTISGEKMLQYQAVAAFEIWTGILPL